MKDTKALLCFRVFCGCAGTGVFLPTMEKSVLTWTDLEGRTS